MITSKFEQHCLVDEMIFLAGQSCEQTLKALSADAPANKDAMLDDLVALRKRFLDLSIRMRQTIDQKE